MTTTCIRRRVLTAAALLTVTLTAACGGGAGRPHRTAERATKTTSTINSAPIPEAGALVARSAVDLAVFATPDAPLPTLVLPAKTSFGSARALLVDDEQGGWLHVILPVRPNGTVGWVRRADVTTRRVMVAVTVNLAERTLVVTDNGVEILRSPVAVGSPASPTPTGRFYVVDKLDTGAPNGPYGPFALGLSGHSDVLTEFAGGDGQVGIHGTSDPSSIGRNVSHGCVRVPNDVAVRLNDLLPLGTPVSVA
jgi:lipoprotein-anchoring transpeptidase ErfK/SrfK